MTREVGGSALFAARFRECAARALLLPRRTPGRRSPLWQQRQRAAQLLDVARKHSDFPMVLEALRECLQEKRSHSAAPGPEPPGWMSSSPRGGWSGQATDNAAGGRQWRTWRVYVTRSGSRCLPVCRRHSPTRPPIR
ncbi:ATP-dependent helicase Lhr [Mycobacteroides abscessus subsp. abscessus]|nr:ATP-dependent helicase Lhr [Mycobacteroides abscessus subsp. abscessus]